MASSSAKGVIVSTDILYLVTFALGMAMFWLSGHAHAMLPHIQNHGLSVVLGLGVTGGVYGLGMFLLTLGVTRRLTRGAVIATVLAIALGLAAAQVIVRVGAPHVHSTTGVGLLTFVLYLFYGAIYVVSLAVARRFAK